LAGRKLGLLLSALGVLRPRVAVDRHGDLGYLTERGRGGAEERAVLDSARHAERVCLPGAEHADVGSLARRAVPGHTLHPDFAGDLPARGGPRRAAPGNRAARRVQRPRGRLRSPLDREAPMSRRFWSNVLAVAYKETASIRHDRALLAAIVAQPIMQMLLLG